MAGIEEASMVNRTQREIDEAVARASYSEGATGESRWVTLVLAFNAAEFNDWCKEHGKNPRDRNIVMATPASVRGLKNSRIEVAPRGMWRRDIHELMTALVPTLDKP